MGKCAWEGGKCGVDENEWWWYKRDDHQSVLHSMHNILYSSCVAWTDPILDTRFPIIRAFCDHPLQQAGYSLGSCVGVFIGNEV